MDVVVRDKARVAVAVLLTLAVWACSRSGYEVAVRDLSVEPECLVEGANALPFASGTGTSDDPYVICTAEQLNGIGATPASMTASFLVRADLDLEGVGFNMIGSEAAPFTGTFDGAEHVIANVSIETTGINHVGFFSSVDNGTIVNLVLADPQVTADGFRIGALAGYVVSAIITNCHARASQRAAGARVYAAGAVSSEVGGLVGGAFLHTTISDSTSAIAVELSSGTSAIGGLVGLLEGSSIVRCGATGNIAAPAAHGNIGGLVGTCYGETYDARAWVQGTYSTSNVNAGDGAFAGGLVGHSGSYCTIDDGYASGTVSAGSFVGGLVGYFYLTSQGARRAYSVGGVAARNVLYAGAFAGGFGPAEVFGVVQSCLWSSELNPGLPAIASTGDLAEVIDVSAAELRQRATFTSRGWDFDTVWTIDPTRNEGYPILRWQLAE